MNRTLLRSLYFGLTAIFSVFLFSRAVPVIAADPYGLQAARNETQYKDSKKSLPEVAGGIIYVALSVIGIVFLGLALYAGYKWMTAAGNEKDAATARDTLTNAMIGLIIIVAAYAITNFLFTNVLGVLVGDGTGPGGAADTTVVDPTAETPLAPAVTLNYCCYAPDKTLLTKQSGTSVQAIYDACLGSYPKLYSFAIPAASDGSCEFKLLE